MAPVPWKAAPGTVPGRERDTGSCGHQWPLFSWSLFVMSLPASHLVLGAVSSSAKWLCRTFLDSSHGDRVGALMCPVHGTLEPQRPCDSLLSESISAPPSRAGGTARARPFPPGPSGLPVFQMVMHGGLACPRCPGTARPRLPPLTRGGWVPRSPPGPPHPCGQSRPSPGCGRSLPASLTSCLTCRAWTQLWAFVVT